MARWEPNARGRIEQAAMDLFQTRGYDRTTVQEIAERAGLTERTFFRYFTDKREVLFGGSGELEHVIVDTLANLPPTTAPLAAVIAALQATTPIFEPRRRHARKRRHLVVAHAELRERELIKLASLAAAIADGLRRRGVPDPSAGLIAEAGIAIFKNAFERWVDDREEHDLSRHIQAALADLKAMAGGPATASRVRVRPSSRRQPSRSRTGSR